MSIVTLLPADVYTVINKGILTEIDKNNVIVHAPYIINLANKEKEEFSVDFLKQEIKRVEELLEEIQYKYKDKNILLVTHGDVCKAIYFYLNKIEEVNDIISFKHKNCEIKKYTI